jgi:hypothetical protein
LVKATIANPAFFSKAALRQRKRQSSNLTGPDPQWLVDYVNQAWEPTAADLKPLLAALAPHYAKFRSIYRPIRHNYFAHRGMDSQQAIEALFSKTIKTDVAEILGFLHTLLCVIREIAWNARQPNLTDFTDYNVFVKGSVSPPPVAFRNCVMYGAEVQPQQSKIIVLRACSSARLNT